MELPAMNARRRAQGGFTLIEVMVALIVAIGIAVAAAAIMQQAQRRTDNANAGEWLRVVAGAARAYEKANRDAIIAAAGPTTPVTVTPAQLAAYLPGGFGTVNGFGQSFTVRFIEPTANKLDGLVMTTGGDVLSGLDLVQVANAAGGGGGYIDPSNPTQGRGPRGNWTRALAPFGGGTGAGRSAYALFYDAATALGGNDGEFLSRVSVPGQPELNRMSAAIDMANNNVTNAGAITASTVSGTISHRSGYMTIGDVSNPAAAAGRVAYNAGSEILSFTTAGGTRVGLDAGDLTGDWVQARNGVVTSGAMQANGSIRGGSLESVSDVTANGYFVTSGGGLYDAAHGGGWYMNDANWIRSYGNKGIYTTGQSFAGSVQSLGRVRTGEYLELGRAETAGGYCAQQGLVAANVDGGMLSCVANVWKSTTGLTGVVSVVSPNYSQGTNTVYAVCPPGTTMTGGGYQTTYMEKGSSPESPSYSYAQPDMNAWVVRGGTPNSFAHESRFVATATCVY